MCYRDRIIRLSQIDYICPKRAFQKDCQKLITYKYLKNFDNEKFIRSLKSTLHDQNHKNAIKNPDICFRVCQDVLNSHKREDVYADDKHFMTKTLSKAISQRKSSRNKLLKHSQDLLSNTLWQELNQLCDQRYMVKILASPREILCLTS